jgi:hypothetical protein
VAADVAVLSRTPIEFGVPGGTQHAPLVTARVGMRESRLVLDTGSDVHLLTKELVDELGLAVEEGEEGTDHSGATFPSWSVEDVGLSLTGVEVVLCDVVSIPAPAPFPGWGIGGILSPQHLHPVAWAVIDLARDELLLVDATAAGLTSWLEGRSPQLTTLVLERDEAFPGVVVDAAVEPHPAIPTMLNTGGGHTEFSRDAVAGRSEAGGVGEQRLGGGVFDSDVVGSLSGRAVLAVGAARLPVEDLAVRAPMHDPQGLVGTDVLRGTVLAVAADRARPVLWQVAPLS